MQIKLIKIKNILGIEGLNPIKLLTASPKDQVDILLSSIVLEFPCEELQEILDIEILPEFDRSAIEVIDGHRKSLYSDRSSLNREIKDKQVMVEQMRETMPEDMVSSEYNSEKLTSLEKQKKEAEGKMVSEQEAIGKNQGDEMVEITEQFNDLVDRINFKAQKDIDELEATKNEKRDALRDHSEAECAKIRVKYKPQIEDLAGQIAVTSERVARADKLKIAEDYVNEGEKELEAKHETVNGLTEKIEALDGLKVDLLKNIPIEGLTILDGEMLLDGIPFETVNEAKRIQFCLAVASMRKPELPLVCVDGLEALDHDSFEIFQREAKKTDMQFFVTRVTDDSKINLQEI